MVCDYAVSLHELLISIETHFPRASDPQCGQQSIPTLPTMWSKNSFNQRQYSSSLKNIELCGMLFEDFGKRELFNCSSTIIVGGV